MLGTVLSDAKYVFASDLVDDRSMDDPKPQEPVSTISIIMKEAS